MFRKSPHAGGSPRRCSCHFDLTYIWVVVGLTLTSFQYLLTAIRNLNFAEEEVYVSYLEIDSYEDPETAAAIKKFEESSEEADK